MKWILDKDIKYHIWYPRGVYGSARNGTVAGCHGGIDVCAKMDTPGIAPEAGNVVWHWIGRNGKYKPKIRWSDGREYFFGRWCSEPYGGVAVLYGCSGNVYLYCHMELSRIVEMKNMYRVSLEDFNDCRSGPAIKVYNTLKDPINVKAGDVIALMGSAGQSSEPHYHFESWENKTRRFDPFSLWPEKKDEFIQHYRRV